MFAANVMGSGRAARVYATWNPADKAASIVLSNGDLTATGNASITASVRATLGVATGKWYWEISVSGTLILGICNSSQILTDFITSPFAPYGTRTQWNGYIIDASSAQQGPLTAWTGGDIIGVALDMGARTCTFYRNGVAYGTTVTAIPAGTIYPAVSQYTLASITATANFGASAFAYSPPGGYNAGLYI